MTDFITSNLRLELDATNQAMKNWADKQKEELESSTNVAFDHLSVAGRSFLGKCFQIPLPQVTVFATIGFLIPRSFALSAPSRSLFPPPTVSVLL